MTQAIQKDDGQTAQAWLALREFRTATRFARPGANATLALEHLVAKTSAPADVLLAVQADLLDTYQARLNEGLADLVNDSGNQYAMRRAEHAALAEGYFAILAPAYAEQRGAAAQKTAQQAFAQLRATALHNQDGVQALAAVQARSAQFSRRPAERRRTNPARRPNLLRYLSLVPVEYGRGIVDGRVNRALEIQEALTFRDGASPLLPI